MTKKFSPVIELNTPIRDSSTIFKKKRLGPSLSCRFLEYAGKLEKYNWLVKGNWN